MDFIPEPKLPYGLGALAPHISEETLKYHHGKHHMAYYNKCKELLAGKTPQPLEEVVRKAEGGLYNQAAQLWNHAFYWRCMAPNASKEVRKPTGAVAELINEQFGSFEAFKTQWDQRAAGHFASGWVWLVVQADRKLAILEGHDGDCPLKGDRGTPILTIDLWEHAYYIDYRNARPSYIAAWWSLVNWDFVNTQLAQQPSYNYQQSN